MPNAEEEARWRAEFEKDGERLVHDTIYPGFDCLLRRWTSFPADRDIGRSEYDGVVWSGMEPDIG
jgi:hypothetical protein